MRGGSIHGEERGSPHATANGTPNVDRIAFPVASSSTGVFRVAKVGRCGQVSGCTRHVGRRSPLASGAAFATMSPPSTLLHLDPTSCTSRPFLLARTVMAGRIRTVLRSSTSSPGAGTSRRGRGHVGPPFRYRPRFPKPGSGSGASPPPPWTRVDHVVQSGSKDQKEDDWDALRPTAMAMTTPATRCCRPTRHRRPCRGKKRCGTRAGAQPRDEGADRGESTQLSTEDAMATAQRFLDALREADLEKVVEELPDGAKDLYYEKFQEVDLEQRMRGVHFPVGLVFFGALQDTEVDQSIDEEISEIFDVSFFIDSYFKRVMLYNRPASVQPLSSLRISRGKFLHRFEAKTENGECVVFSVSCQVENSLQPCYKSVEVVRRWSITSVRGECASSAPRPSVELSPEVVVATQIEALRNLDFETVFAFASPSNRSVTGPLDKFIGLLNTPFYVPLVGYTSMEILYSEQVGVAKYVQRVMVTADATSDTRKMADAIDPGREQDKIWIGPLLLSHRRGGKPTVSIIYEWQVGLTSDFSVSPDEQFWMTDAVKPLLGPAASTSY